MGARHSKRSMDVTTTPKKEGTPAEGGDTPAIGDGKLERIEEIDAKPTTNGVAPHIDTPEEKDVKDKDSTTEKEKDKNDEDTKEAEETKVDTQAESPTEGGDNVTTPTEEKPASPTSVSSPETKESKKKDKPKKKWSFRSISFSKKDKNKPVREETPKNGDVSKEEPLTEGGEDAENATAAVNGTEEKSAPTSPTETSSPPTVDAKEDEEPASPSSAATTEASPVDDENEATVAAPSSPIAPNPVPVETKKDEAEKEEVETKIVEVSPVQAIAVPVEVTTHTQPIVTPSIIERKTSEDFHSLFPSSPPPTPIDPSPLQQAQQAAANADALAEALKLPAQTINQSQNNSYPADDQKYSNSFIERSNESTIENHPIVDEKTINIPDMQENVLVVKNVEEIEVQKTQQTTLHSSDNLQTDIVIQTEEGPIPVSNDDIEVEIESKIIGEIIDNVQAMPSEVVDHMKKIGDEILTNVAEISYNNDTISDEKLNMRKNEDDVPPPLPESPVPMPKTTTDLLNFMTSQIEDTRDSLEDVINITNRLSTENVAADASPAVPPSVSTVTNDIPSDIELPNELCNISDPVNIVPQSQDVDDLPLPPPKVAAYDIVPESITLTPGSPIENLLTPPRSPSPILELNDAINECAPLVINGHDNNAMVDNGMEKNICETRLELVKQNISETNNDTKNDLKDRLADTIEKEELRTTTMVACPLTHHIENDEQSIAELAAPVDNSGLSETIEEAPKKVIAEAPVSPSSKAPMITEDVASVTKAVEEIDINEKAVAAAVNENIECTKNEIIAEMNHQNNLNE